MVNNFYIYTGLTEAQWWDLRDAQSGKLIKMNGARHDAMSRLIDENLKLTSFGQTTFNRATRILAGWIPAPLIEDVPSFNALRFKKYLQKHIGGITFTTGHAKLIYSLACHPDQSYNVLVDGYGTKTIDDLGELGVIIGQPWKYYWMCLSTPAIDLLKSYLKEHPNG